MQTVFRFAPSPNGPLHLGHALSALLNARLARRFGGKLLLRIDNIDQERCRPEYERAIIEDCHWLGLGFDGRPRRQTDHLVDYAATIARLRTLGLAYPAFLSRGAIARRVAAAEEDGSRWPRDPDGAPHYPPDDRAISPAEAEDRIKSGAPFAIRLNSAKAVGKVGSLRWREFSEDAIDEAGPLSADPLEWGDVMLAGRETAASYHLAVVVDDAAQGVTHVVRGKDLLPATSIHRLLQRLLDLPEPIYHHHRLILDADGRKLAKSDRDTGLSELRDGGVTPRDIEQLVGLTPG